MLIKRARSQVVLEVEYEALGLSSIHGLIDQYNTGFDKQDTCLAVVVSEQEIFNWDNCRRPVEELSTLIVILNLKFFRSHEAVREIRSVERSKILTCCCPSTTLLSLLSSVYRIHPLSLFHYIQ